MAKKKESPKERREREKQAKKQLYLEKEQERKKIEEEKQAIEQLCLERENKVKNIEDEKTNKGIYAEKKALTYGGKSLVKANGLKSMFLVDERMILTGFGKGNISLLESEYINGEKKQISNPGTFSSFDEERTINISRDSSMKAGHATKVALRDDLIGAKADLEKRYFGQEFANDNIHVQIAYNILDIDKFLAEYINTIVYSKIMFLAWIRMRI